MNRLFVPTLGPTDWRRLLADPTKQWRQKKSAYESAVAWEAARTTQRGLPTAVATLFDSEPSFTGATLLLGIPEHQVVLDGGGHASQTDFWALISSPSGVVSTAVEAKAGESFDRLVSDWLDDSKPGSGKPARLAQLCKLLEISEDRARKCRYQLMHRPACALLEARRFKLSSALFLVHAFGDNKTSFNDYCTWASELGIAAKANQLHQVGIRGGITLWIAWLGTDCADDTTVRAAI